MNEKEFESKCEGYNFPIHIISENADIGGGITTIEDIDKLKDYENIDQVIISGLRQNTFEYFIKTYGDRIKDIYFCKNKFIEDFSPLGDLKNIEFISFFGNQRAVDLWDMSNNKSMKGLSIRDFTRMHTIEKIKTAPVLERLEFRDAIWPTGILDSIKPLENTKLKEFNFGAKKIIDNDITVYAKMPNLEILHFPTNFYTTEQIAWLVAKLPNVKGYALRPCIYFERKEGEEEYSDTLICGKRKPFLHRDKHQKRIEQYISKFNNLVDTYKNDPTLLPPT